MSKEKVKAAYRQVQDLSPEEAGPPVGPLDFHDGSAELLIGGLLYSPTVQSILRYDGIDLIRVIPGCDGEPGSISAVFTDDNGSVLLRLEENEWVGSLENWDIEIVGRRLTVRQGLGKTPLQLRLDPPGRIIVERLDMRIGDGHVLATDKTYAVGCYSSDGSVHWIHAGIHIRRSSPRGAAIEFTDSEVLETRDRQLSQQGQGLAVASREIVMSSEAGVMVKPLGIVIASLCGAFDLAELAVGSQPLDEMRRVILEHPEELCRFISTGKTV